MVGHCYSVFLRFKGGKAVACFIGAFRLSSASCLSCELTRFHRSGRHSANTFHSDPLSRHWYFLSLCGGWIIRRSRFLLASIFAALLIIYPPQDEYSALGERERNVFSLKGGSLKGDST